MRSSTQNRVTKENGYSSFSLCLDGGDVSVNSGNRFFRPHVNRGICLHYMAVLVGSCK